MATQKVIILLSSLTKPSLLLEIYKSIYAKAVNPEEMVQQLCEVYLKSYTYEVYLSPASYINCFYSSWEEGRQIKISRSDTLPIQSAGPFLNHWLRVQKLGYCLCNDNVLFRSLLSTAASAEHSKTSSLQAAWTGRDSPVSSLELTGEKSSCGTQPGRATAPETAVPPYRCEQPTHNACLMPFPCNVYGVLVMCVHK